MNVLKALLATVLFLNFKLDAAIKPSQVIPTDIDKNKAEAIQKTFLENKNFQGKARETLAPLKDVSLIVDNPNELENAVRVINKIADEADKLIESNDPQNERVRLAVYKTLGKKLRNFVQHLRTIVDKTTIDTIPATAKVLKLAIEIGTNFDQKNTLNEADVRIGIFIRSVDKILGNNLDTGKEELNYWNPNLMDLEYLFWFEQCILPLVPDTITINLRSENVRVERQSLIEELKSIIENSKISDLQNAKTLFQNLQNEIKALKIYNKNPDGPFSNVIFNGGKMAGISVEGLLKSLTQQDRQELEAKEKRDRELAKGPAIDANWWFSRETWNAILSIMQISATVINVTQHIQRETQKLQEARETYAKYTQIQKEEASKLTQNLEKTLRESSLSPKQQKNIDSNVKTFLKSPDTTSARSLMYEASLLGEKGEYFEGVSQCLKHTVKNVCPADTFLSLMQSVDHVNKLPIGQTQKDYLIGFINAVDNPKLYSNTKLPPGALIIGEGGFQEQVMDVMRETCNNLDCHIIEIDGAKLKTPDDVQSVFNHARTMWTMNNQKQFVVFRDMEAFATVNRDKNPLDSRVEVVNQMLTETTKEGANVGLTWIGTSKTPKLDSALSRAGRFNIAFIPETITKAKMGLQFGQELEAQETAAKQEEAANKEKLEGLVDGLIKPANPHVSVMLLKGPPGNGKGFTAETLAKKASCLQISVDPVNIDTTEEVNNQFAKIRSNIEKSDNQCFVILLDEFDAIAGFNRDDPTYKGTDVMQRRVAVTDKIIAEIKALESNPPAGKSGIVMAATNNPDNLDKQFINLVDPSLNIHLPYPSASSREWLFKNLYLKKQPNDFTAEQWKTIIKKTSGCNIATLKEMVRDAIFLQKSLHVESGILTFEVFEKAMNTVLEKNALIQPTQEVVPERGVKQYSKTTSWKQKPISEPSLSSKETVGMRKESTNAHIVDALHDLKQSVQNLNSTLEFITKNLQSSIQKIKNSIITHQETKSF